VGSNSISSIFLSFSTGPVSGNWDVGGLAGTNSGNILSSYSTGTVNGNTYVGGLVGSTYQSILSSTYQSNISSSYSIGTVSGSKYVGGLLGYYYDDNNIISSSFWDTQTSGQVSSAGGTGLSTAEMQNINTFLNAGWDFVEETDNGTEDIWFMPENSYPIHSWNSGIMD
jgi:hypothetical protein